MCDFPYCRTLIVRSPSFLGRRCRAESRERARGCFQVALDALVRVRMISYFGHRAGGNDAIDGDTTEFGGSASRCLAIAFTPSAFIFPAVDFQHFCAPCNIYCLRCSQSCFRLFPILFNCDGLSALCFFNKPSRRLHFPHAPQSCFVRRAFTYTLNVEDAADEAEQ
jgi:hypothetical protein